MPFGAAQSPAIFCNITMAAADIFNAEFKARGVQANCAVYVDDFFIAADNHAHMRQAFEIMDEVGQALGLTWNLDKDLGRHEPLQSLEFLGVVIDAEHGVLRLPANKKAAYRSEVSSFRTKHVHAEVAPRKPFKRLVGKLCFAATITPYGFTCLQHCFDALYPWDHRLAGGLQSHFVPYPEESRQELLFWDGLLYWPDSIWHGLDRYMVGSREYILGSHDMEIFTDASSSHGWGAVMDGSLLAGRWYDISETDITGAAIAWKETRAVRRALEAHYPDLRCRNVLIRTDNMATLAAINRGAARWPGGRQEIMAIANLAASGHFRLRATHVSGVDNPADGPSRGHVSISPVAIYLERLFSREKAVLSCTSVERCYSCSQPNAGVSNTDICAWLILTWIATGDLPEFSNHRYNRPLQRGSVSMP